MTSSGLTAMNRVSSGDVAEGSQQEFGTRPVTRSWVYSPHYRFRTFKSRKVVLIMVWSFCVLFLVRYLIDNHYNSTLKFSDKIEPFHVFVMCLLVYPILGWLADVLFGRYRVIKWSFNIVWVLLILSCLSIALLQYYPAKRKKLSAVLTFLFYIPISIGIGGVLANIIQFGTDQLADAASTEINSFFRWLVWLWFLSGVCTGLSQWCICPKYEVISYMSLPIIFTVAVVLDHLFNQWLVKDSVELNSFSLIFRVLKYAMRNKYPRLRSAFTYGEEKPYTRIDLAKNKYGGPFSTEQVEDVKTFFRIVGVVIVGTLFTGMFLVVYPTFPMVTSSFRGGQYNVESPCEPQEILNCYQVISVYFSGDFLMVLIFPICEVFLYPCLKRWLAGVSILRRLNVGLVIIVISLICCTVLEFVAVHEYRDLHQNISIGCAFNATGIQVDTLPLDYKWTALLYILIAVAQFVVMTSFIEFLCAQSPYSMKGILIGFAYGALGFFVIIGYVISKSFQDHVIVKFMSFSYGCMAWYLVLNLAILLVTFVMFYGAYKCYKSRFRDSSGQTDTPYYSSISI